MKKIRVSVLIIFTFVTAMLCSCSLSEDKPGGELIKQAREEYVGLNSARVTITNTATGEIEQEFVFKYDEKDILTYSYYGKNEDEIYAQYNNGVEQFTYENGEYSYLSKGEKGFSVYTRSLTHPQADKGLLIYEPSSITDVTVTETDEGNIYSYKYNVEKIGADTGNGTVVGFTAEYLFDKNDKLVSFTEITKSEENGGEKEYSYRVEITDKNAVEKVENTTDQFKPK